MSHYLKTKTKLELLERIGQKLSEAENLALDMGMGEVAMQLKGIYTREIETAHRHICETELPVTIRGNAYIPKDATP